MNPESDISSPQLESFDKWLAEPAVQAPSGLLERVRGRIAEENQAWEKQLDALFAKDPSLRNPDMVARIRQKISRKPDQNKVIWFQWLTPVAAALILGIAFFSFQTRAPSPEAVPALQSQMALSTPAELSVDPELTRIFALAANLQGTSDMSRLQSVDDLAFLFE